MTILVVRLGAMGDVIHALPAAAALRKRGRLLWAVEPRWAPLVAGCADEVVPVDRRSWASIRAAFGRLRAERFDEAYDFQGLIKSALTARAARGARVRGYAQPREGAAKLFYDEAIAITSAHIVDQHRELAGANEPPVFPLPAGSPEGSVPSQFVLACPFAGWRAKEWPLERYSELARRIESEFQMPLVLNGHAAARHALAGVKGTMAHISTVNGLIAATRQAHAVIGVDSGPLHLAAALGKPGVAVFGPTDPARNGPYGRTIRVLRHSQAATTYKRRNEYDPSMLAITPQAVMEALRNALS